MESEKLNLEYSKSVRNLIAAGIPRDLAFNYYTGYLLYGDKFCKALKDASPDHNTDIFLQTIRSQEKPASNLVSTSIITKADLEQKSSTNENKSKKESPLSWFNHFVNRKKLPGNELSHN